MKIVMAVNYFVSHFQISVSQFIGEMLEHLLACVCGVVLDYFLALVPEYMHLVRYCKRNDVPKAGVANLC